MSGRRPPLWTSDEAARATDGRSTAPWRADGVSIDSRTLAAGDLFIALSGPNHDGHAFVAAALARGAAAAMVARRPDDVDTGAPLLLVGDTMRGLVDLARAARQRSGARIIAVTGSVGKTGVKDALRLLLSQQGETSATAGSLNNHWGLPMSLARLPQSAAYAVAEMGMNHPGEIAPLSRLARPHVAVVTTVAAVHRAYFASEEEIADAKAEIFAGLAADGCAVLNRDNPHYDRLAAAAAAAGIGRVIAFGRDPAADVRLVAAELGAAGSQVHASVLGRTVHYRLSVPGEHWVGNSLCVLAAVAAAGADAEQAAADLARFSVPKGRGQIHRIGLGDGALQLIDDSYNASPVSMAASFDVLARAVPAPGGRRIAVLGDMLELGDEAPRLHRELAGSLRRRGIDLVFTAGPMMAHLFEALPPAMRGGHAGDAAALVPLVTAAMRGGDVVAVKGSAGSRMGTVVRALQELDDPAGDGAGRGGERGADGPIVKRVVNGN